MAEAAAPAKGLGATLGKKIGPLPAGVWLAGGLGLWWYFRKQQQASQTAPNATTSQTGYGTDPAGNTGYIDPSTGYVYGSAEDVAALQSQGLVGANSFNTGGTGDTSGTGASGSSMAGGDTGGVNSSGTGITLPGGPGNGTGGTTTPGGPPSANKGWRYPAPSGLSAHNVSDSGFGLSWQPVQGPNGQHPSTYTVATFQTNGVKVDQFASGSTSTKEYGAGGKGLHPGWTYRVDVWANGGPLAPPHASTTVTLKPKGSK